MKVGLIAFLIIVALGIGCTRKDASYYSKKFSDNKSDFLLIRDSINKLLIKKDSLYKFSIEFTGRRLVEYPYVNKDEMHNFYDVNLSTVAKEKLSGIMYNLNIKYAIVYHDRCEYIFSGRFRDTIVVYNEKMDINRGKLIDVDTYFILSANRKQ